MLEWRVAYYNNVGPGIGPGGFGWIANSGLGRELVYFIDIKHDGHFHFDRTSKELIPKRIPRQPTLESAKRRCEKIERRLKKEKAKVIKQWRNSVDRN